VKIFLDTNQIKYSEFPNVDAMVKQVAAFIHQDSVVGWFQGRMEFGPRALGNRSILSNPCNPKMQEILNLKVKHREKFRPFAPVVCADDAATYFECDQPIPEPTDFMLMVYPVRRE
jgi:carbamoyltransferase